MRPEVCSLFERVRDALAAVFPATARARRTGTDLSRACRAEFHSFAFDGGGILEPARRIDTHWFCSARIFGDRNVNAKVKREPRRVAAYAHRPVGS
jgi:hypothetical protein